MDLGALDFTTEDNEEVGESMDDEAVANVAVTDIAEEAQAFHVTQFSRCLNPLMPCQWYPLCLGCCKYH